MSYRKTKLESALVLGILLGIATLAAGCASNAHAGYAFTASVASAPPPTGFHVAAPPRGYRLVKVGSARYYYHSGTFYQRSGKRYVVVRAPLNARVSTLPRSAKVVVFKGKPYWHYRGAHYRWQSRSRAWVVVRP